MKDLRLEPLSLERAVELTGWRYEPPYDVYGMADAEPGVLADPSSGFHAVLDGDELVGFRSFGTDGQVPGWSYDASALDTGGGMRPDLTGRGIGGAVLEAGLAFGRERFMPDAFRVTVAAWNARALRVVTAVGFLEVDRFYAPLGTSYVVLVLDEPAHRRTARTGGERSCRAVSAAQEHCAEEPQNAP